MTWADGMKHNHQNTEQKFNADVASLSRSVSACQCRRFKKAGSIPGMGSSPGGGHDNPLQYSCLEHPMDRGAWRATVHRAAKSRTLCAESLSDWAHLTNMSATLCSQVHECSLCLSTSVCFSLYLLLHLISKTLFDFSASNRPELSTRRV